MYRRVCNLYSRAALRRLSTFAPVTSGERFPKRRDDNSLPTKEQPISGTSTPLSPLSDRMDGITSLVGYDSNGFNINGVHMRGSVLVFDTFSLLWNVTRVLDVSPRSLSPVHMVKPRPTIVLLGTGDTVQNVNPALFGYLSRKGISLEVLTTVREKI